MPSSGGSGKCGTRTMRHFIDIDGTLTYSPDTSWGQPRRARIEYVKELVAAGNEVILWSARGTEYAKAFASMHGLKDHVVAIGKPQRIVDDKCDYKPAKGVTWAANTFFAVVD